jgi:hypothetical protein
MRSELRRLIGEGVNLIHTHQTSLLGSIVPWIWKSPQVALIATRHMMSTHNKRDIFHGAIYSRVDALVADTWRVISQFKDSGPSSGQLADGRLGIVIVAAYHLADQLAPQAAQAAARATPAREDQGPSHRAREGTRHQAAQAAAAPVRRVETC